MAVPVNQTRENLAVWRYMEVIGVVKKGNRVGRKLRTGFQGSVRVTKSTATKIPLLAG